MHSRKNWIDGFSPAKINIWLAELLSYSIYVNKTLSSSKTKLFQEITSKHDGGQVRITAVKRAITGEYLLCSTFCHLFDKTWRFGAEYTVCLKELGKNICSKAPYKWFYLIFDQRKQGCIFIWIWNDWYLGNQILVTATLKTNWNIFTIL